MKKVINTLVNILKGSKYTNTPQYEEDTTQTSTKYTVETDEYGYSHFKKNGLSHRIAGPAITYRSGATKYYLEGEELSEEEHFKLVSSNTDWWEFHSDKSTEEEAAFSNLLSSSSNRRAPSSYNY